MIYNVCGLQYDKNRSGALELEELHAVLADLGIMVSSSHHLPEIASAYRKDSGTAVHLVSVELCSFLWQS